MAQAKTTDTPLERTVTFALRTLAALIMGVTAACFVQSYRQLFDFATRHLIPLWIAPIWPAMLDVFVLIAEITLFVAIVKRWPWWVLALAWPVALAGLVASVAAQWLYLPATATTLDRGSAVIAPLGATIGLALGLIVLKLSVTQPIRESRTDTSSDELGKRRRTRRPQSSAERSRRYRQRQRQGAGA